MSELDHDNSEVDKLHHEATSLSEHLARSKLQRSQMLEKEEMRGRFRKELEDHWSCSSPERLSHCKLIRFKLIENRPMKVYSWTLLTPGAWPNLTQGHDWHNL